MASGLFSPLWVTVTAIIAVLLLLYLFPLMLEEWGLIGALLGTVLLLFGLSLAYLRGYWVSQWLMRKRNRDK